MRRLLYSALALAAFAPRLVAQATGGQSTACAGSSADAEMRSAALEGLLRMDATDAVPILTGVLKQRDACRVELRKQAVSLLARKGGDGALPILVDVVSNDPSDEVKRDAVFWLGRQHLVDLEFFKKLYKASADEEIRGQVIQAVVRLESKESAQWLLDLAKDKSADDESRKNAIFWASKSSTIDLDQLAGIYAAAADNDEVQKQVLFVYSRRSEPAAVDKLIAIATADQNIEMRKQALFWLGRTSDPRARQLLRDLIAK
jgi:HEAT repeat protein